MTTPDAQYPDDDHGGTNRATGHDLDPNADGDLVLTVSVGRTQALVIGGNSTDSNTWSASVRWVDEDDNEFVSEANTDTELNAVTNDWARLVRKGPVAEVTFTSEETVGTANAINAFVDAHR